MHQDYLSSAQSSTSFSHLEFMVNDLSKICEVWEKGAKKKVNEKYGWKFSKLGKIIARAALKRVIKCLVASSTPKKII